MTMIGDGWMAVGMTMTMMMMGPQFSEWCGRHICDSLHLVAETITSVFSSALTCPLHCTSKTGTYTQNIRQQYFGVLIHQLASQPPEPGLDL